MCNYNKLDDETKALLHSLLRNSADSIGGTNFLLKLIEAMRKNKPNALMQKACKVDSAEASITWKKIVFKDKLDILEDVFHFHKNSQDTNFNILKDDNEKRKKKILNMVKTLAPIEFNVNATNPENGAGFSFKIFETIEENNVTINPLFAAMFFCSIDFTKQALKYNSK